MEERNQRHDYYSNYNFRAKRVGYDAETVALSEKYLNDLNDIKITDNPMNKTYRRSYSHVIRKWANERASKMTPFQVKESIRILKERKYVCNKQGSLFSALSDLASSPPETINDEKNTQLIEEQIRTIQTSIQTNIKQKNIKHKSNSVPKHASSQNGSKKHRHVLQRKNEMKSAEKHSNRKNVDPTFHFTHFVEFQSTFLNRYHGEIVTLFDATTYEVTKLGFPPLDKEQRILFLSRMEILQTYPICAYYGLDYEGKDIVKINGTEGYGIYLTLHGKWACDHAKSGIIYVCAVLDAQNENSCFTTKQPNNNDNDNKPKAKIVDYKVVVFDKRNFIPVFKIQFTKTTKPINSSTQTHTPQFIKQLNDKLNQQIRNRYCYSNRNESNLSS